MRVEYRLLSGEIQKFDKKKSFSCIVTRSVEKITFFDQNRASHKYGPCTITSETFFEMFMKKHLQQTGVSKNQLPIDMEGDHHQRGSHLCIPRRNGWILP